MQYLSHADRILALVDGQIGFAGTFNELMGSFQGGAVSSSPSAGGPSASALTQGLSSDRSQALLTLMQSVAAVTQEQLGGGDGAAGEGKKGHGENGHAARNGHGSVVVEKKLAAKDGKLHTEEERGAGGGTIGLGTNLSEFRCAAAG